MLNDLNLGIESTGMSLSVLALSDSHGRILGCKRFDTGLNYHEMRNSQIAAELAHMLNSFLDSMDLKSETLNNGSTYAHAGITGVACDLDETAGMAEVWRDIGFSSACCSSSGDKDIILETIPEESVLLVVAKTGSIVCGRDKRGGGFITCGGWGRLLGDEGGGYWIGIKSLSYTTQIIDGRISDKTVLQDVVLNALLKNPRSRVYLETLDVSTPIRTPRKLQNAIIGILRVLSTKEDFRDVISGIAREVLYAWENDPSDRILSNVVQSACAELCRSLSTVIGRMPSDRTQPHYVYLCGGIFLKHRTFTDFFRKIVLSAMPKIIESPGQIRLYNETISTRPVVGSLMYCLRQRGLASNDYLSNLSMSSALYGDLKND